jgi:succinate dehydrogenase flavin-adding protein (antitoxin of CptAB toxin-antitoxin module)
MKNPLIENLRVAVVPTEADNNIDQSSSVEEILACPDTTLYPITDYFKAQNDEEFPIHWSFLIDMVNNVDITGSNLDNVHQFDRPYKIDTIKSLIKEWGCTTTAELELDEVILSENSYHYEELPDDVIDEIYHIIEDYDVKMKKLMNSTHNENY